MQIKQATEQSAANALDMNCLKNTVLLTCKVSRWGNRARCRNPQAIEAYYALTNGRGAMATVETDAGKENKARRVSTSKVLIYSKAFDELCDALRRLKGRAMNYTMPSFTLFRGGAYVVKRDQVEFLKKLLDEGIEEINKTYVPAFELDYPNAIERSRVSPVSPSEAERERGITPGLGPLFEAKDYPAVEVLRRKFGVSYSVFAVTVPEGLPPEIRAEEERKLRTAYAESIQAMRDALREMFAKLLDNAVDKLAPKAGERGKRFNDTLIGNLNDFFETFDARNITNDAVLADLVAKCKAVIAGVTPDRLRSSADFKQQTGEALAKIKAALDPMMEEIAERSFDFSED